MEVKSGGGIGIVGILTIVFVVLKLTNNIDWSWWWVLSPIWISIVASLIILIIVLIVLLLFEIIRPRRTRWHERNQIKA